MNTSAKAAQSRQEELEQILSVTQRANTGQKQAAKESSTQFAQIESNPFFVAAFDSSTSPDAKQQQIAKLLTYEGTREELRENRKAYAIFKEYLQSIREEMAVETIKMSDPKNFAVLRDTYESMNTGLIQFENNIKPLTDLLEALEQLRTEGTTMDVFREIKDEDERLAAVDARIAEIETMIENTKSKIREIDTNISVLDEDKNWFGQIKKSAKEQQIRLVADKEHALEELEEKQKEFQDFQHETASVRDSSTKNADAKQKLKEMLDLSNEGHQKRGEELISSAVEFVANSKQKIGIIKDHLSHMEGQINKLSNSNDDMAFVFALLDGGTKIAEDNNKVIREKLSEPKENENSVERLTRETKKRDLDEHISMLESSAHDTTATIADLTSQSIRIKDMKDSNQGQIQMASEMHARGVAGVADRISTVIQAVGQAALSESSNLAASTLDEMRRNTDMLAQKHSLQVAMGIQDRNKSLEEAIENLQQYGRVHEEATKITKAGLAEMSDLINRMETSAREVADNVSKSYAQVADSVMGETGTETKTTEKGKTSPIKSPFSKA